MDGDPVIDAGEPSLPSSSSLASKTYTEIFIDVFPRYLAMGMTYEQFWYGPAWLVKSYREAAEINHREDEFARWRQGMYFYNALGAWAPVMRAALSKRAVEPGKYFDEPLPVSAREAKERKRNKELETFKRMLATMNKESEQNKKKRAKEEAAKKQKEASEVGERD